MLPCWLTGCSKRLLAAWEAARKRRKMKKKMNVGGEPKETAVSREIMPADGSNPAQRGVRHVPAYDRQQLISHRRAWQTVKLAVIYQTHPSMHAGPLDFQLLLDLAPQ